MKQTVRLTQYSHGTGCGCKISPKVLETILHSIDAAEPIFGLAVTGIVPTLPGVESYIEQGCVPGGTARNVFSYGQLIGDMPEAWRDPQTSGGLLLAVRSEAEAEVFAVAERNRITLSAIGELKDARAGHPMIEIH